MNSSSTPTEYVAISVDSKTWMDADPNAGTPFVCQKNQGTELVNNVSFLLLLLTYLSHIDLPTLIKWTHPFPYKRLLGGIFLFLLEY